MQLHYNAIYYSSSSGRLVVVVVVVVMVIVIIFSERLALIIAVRMYIMLRLLYTISQYCNRQRDIQYNTDVGCPIPLSSINNVDHMRVTIRDCLLPPPPLPAKDRKLCDRNMSRLRFQSISSC